MDIFENAYMAELKLQELGDTTLELINENVKDGLKHRVGLQFLRILNQWYKYYSIAEMGFDPGNPDHVKRIRAMHLMGGVRVA